MSNVDKLNTLPELDPQKQHRRLHKHLFRLQHFNHIVRYPCQVKTEMGRIFFIFFSFFIK